MIDQIVSGGQTGVDRAALDAALALAWPCNGWCPHGRRAEDGVIPARYPLRETPKANYPQRTEWNVRDSDGTLVLTRGRPCGGTLLTVQLARRQDKPCLVIDLTGERDLSARVTRAYQWVTRHRVRRLNVAGPRESQQPGIHDQAYHFIEALLKADES